MEFFKSNTQKNTNQTNSYYCNNCNTRGHTFNNCNSPIVSIGIVAYKKIENNIKFLMICRKDSLGFIEFVRGKYPLYDKKYIFDLINEMTINEKEILLTKSFNEIWSYLWGEYTGLQFRIEDKYAKEKFEQITRGVKNINDEYNLESIINSSETTWKTPEWGFPKGRKNYKELDIKCALREFNEETGYDKESLDIITNINSLEEIFMGSNYKIYKHKYFIAKFLGDTLEKEFQKTEVSDMKWLTLEECIKHIRPYNIEKVEIIKNINNALLEYRLIS
tara:strand:+ start:1612 stop:2442 length:831 start_codon:yes stop_codon:yes gene_type:complete